jgi:CUB/sushi domain-containing protein
MSVGCGSENPAASGGSGDLDVEPDGEPGDGDTLPDAQPDGSDVVSTPDEGRLDTGDSTDASDTGDGGPGDTDGSGGEPGPVLCESDDDCAVGECVELAPDAAICAEPCSSDDDCADGTSCLLIANSGSDAVRVCIPVNFCLDQDGDRFGVGPGCLGVDCNDDNDAVNLAADEVCDGFDNDCDELVDDNTIGNGEVCETGFQAACSAGRFSCVDGSRVCVPDQAPVAEFCDGQDNDCNGDVDDNIEPLPLWYLDGDGDGVGGSTTINACRAPEGYVDSTGDCDDDNEAVYPGATEVCDGLDQNCDGDIDQDGTVRPCEVIECGGLTAPPNGSVDVGDGTGFGATAVYTCNPGYDLLGVSSRACGADGLWTGSRPECAPADCGAPGAVTNATLRVTSTTTGSTATYECVVGYQPAAGSALSRTCEATGWTWNGTPLQCERVVCGEPSTISNGSASTPDGQEFGDVATYSCNEGYSLTGVPTRACQADGVWSGVAPQCTANDCGTPSTVSNTTINAPTTTTGSVATYTCQTGYDQQVSTVNTRTCLSTGWTWTGTPINCTRRVCGAPAPLTNGSVNTPDGQSFGDLASYACDSGYAISGPTTTTCQANGSWSVLQASCIPQDCGVPPTIANANVNAPSTTTGSTATFTCRSGFNQRPSTVRTAACTADGWSFSGTALVCDRVSCGDPEPLPFGSVDTAGGTLFGSTATYACNPGYELAGLPTVTCQASGAWSALGATCVPADCGAPPAVSNATFSAAATTTGSVATYSCRAGYTQVAGTSRSRTCQATGWQWSGSALLCEPVSCDTPPGTANGSVATPDGLTFGSRAVYSCDGGYTLSGTTTATCQADRTWSSPPPTCVASDCGSVPVVTNATVDVPFSTTGSTATWTCQNGYTARAETVRTLTCTPIGWSWTGTPLACDPVSCGDPGVLANGSVTTPDGRVFGASAVYACNPGYSLNGDPLRPCLATGSWSATIPTCQALSCGAPAAVANASFSAPATTTGSTATFTCNAGYTQRSGTGNAQLCGATGWSWTGTALVCDPVSCGDPGAPANGSVSTPNGRTFGESALYVCDAGYTLAGEGTRVCGANGAWSPARPACIASSCGTPSAIPNASVVAPVTTTGASATYTCNDGYQQRSGTVRTRTCDATGWTWNGTALTCDPISCGTPDTNANSTVSTPGGTTFGQRASYGCNNGYDRQGDAFRDCQSNGTWSGSAPICQIRDCGSLSVLNGNVSVPDGTTVGGQATYSCGNGYVLSGAATRTCLPEGVWSGTAATCQPVNCGGLTLSNGVVNTPDGTTLGQTATFTCNSGYNRSGPASRTCQADGSWSGSATSCVIVDCGVLPPVINGSVSTPNGTTFGAAAAYTCSSGYQRVGDASRSCQADGSWSGAAPVCILPCGDGILQPGQACDDGNTSAGDGCSAFCEIETGFECVSVPSVCGRRKTIEWTPNFYLEDYATYTTPQQTLSDCNTVVRAEVESVWTPRHNYAGDLVLSLRSPGSGSSFITYRNGIGGSDDLTTDLTAITSTSIINRGGNGTWQWRAYDDSIIDEATISRVTVTVWCR